MDRFQTEKEYILACMIYNIVLNELQLYQPYKLPDLWDRLYTNMQKLMDAAMEDKKITV